MSTFREISIDDPDIEEYWRAGILYVAHTPKGRKHFGLSEDYDNDWIVDKATNDEYSPKYFQRGIYKYALQVEE